MIVLDAMDQAPYRVVHGELHKHDRRKEGEDHGRCGYGCRAFVAWHWLVMGPEIEADLPLD
jgi:hypothetical protein